MVVMRARGLESPVPSDQSECGLLEYCPEQEGTTRTTQLTSVFTTGVSF